MQRLDIIRVKEFLMNLMSKVNNLYIHVPFCIKKCIYCDFYSIPFKSHIARHYIEALCREIELRKDVVDNLTTVYIGGGTPTILSETEIFKILSAVKDNCSIEPDAEITIEANPRTITAEKAEKLLRSGINRISIGIQSFIDDELAVLGRSHNADDAINAVNDFRKAGFRNISIDLIYGIPVLSSQQSGGISQELQIKNWGYSLQKTLELSPEHISIYELTPEKDTPLYEDIKSKRLVMPEEEVISEMYYKGIDMLFEHGYIHYEISNFAKQGYECRHNLNYWNRGEYLGIGAGAHSFFNGKRTNNVRDIALYVELIDKGIIPLAEEVEIKGNDVINEYIFLGLRKTEGIDIHQILMPNLSREGREETVEVINKAVKELSCHGLVETKGNHLKLTRKGLLICNEVILKLML